MSSDYQWVIERATIVDGTGGARSSGTVAIRDGKLEIHPGASGLEADRTIDASGLTIAPGFIDIHGHTDFLPYVDPFASSKLFDGVTLDVSGNCGFSAFPLDAASRERENRLLEPFGVRIDWEDFSSYRAGVERTGTGIHRALFVGHGNLRKFIIGYENRSATRAELDAMCGLLGDLLDQGAIGFTTGLIYPPGCYAGMDEVTELVRVVAGRGKLYASHIRGEGQNLIAAIDEILAVAVATGARTQISHLKASGPKNWFKIDEVLEKIAAVRARGFPVMADRYPYTATNTFLDTCLRAWAHEGGAEAQLRRLSDSSIRRTILDEMKVDYSPEHFSRVMISSVSSPGGRSFEGRTVEEIARERGLDPYEGVLSILEECRGEVGAIFFTLNEDIMRRVLSLDYVMIASDGTAQVPQPPYIEGMPHPRSYGTFSRVLGPLCRDEGLFTLETAVAKMTGMPAQQLGLTDRGLVKPGYRADLTIFDSQNVKDCATYREPHQFSSGIRYVFVNGELVLDQGEKTGLRPGKVLG